MLELHNIIITFLIALLGTLWIHPKILKIAILKNIVDNPDARKLQRNPVPVLGGLAVFFGIIIGICSSQAMFNAPEVFMLMAAMLIMLYVGTIDDVLGLTPTMRFIIEILVVLWLIYVNEASINSLWGLFGITGIPVWVAVPLSVFAAVGIINAINLIDGVNGLSSGFCFMASTLFAIIFYISNNATMTIIAVTAAGAIIPFFLHNVFGNKTKMFIGDGGTLMIGIMMSIFVINILCKGSDSSSLAARGFGLVPFTVAVLAIPVFDTLRVMSTRIIKGKSPFSPDKTHLHHMFIDLGFSHIGTTVSILTLNFLVVVIWFVSCLLGAPVELQLLIVILLGISATFLFYMYAEKQLGKNGKGLERLKKISKKMNFEKKGIWKKVQEIIDKV